MERSIKIKNGSTALLFQEYASLICPKWQMCKYPSPICLGCLSPQISTLKQTDISLFVIILPNRMIHVLIHIQIQKHPQLTPDLVIEMNYFSLTNEHI